MMARQPNSRSLDSATQGQIAPPEGAPEEFLARGQAYYERSQWNDAFEALSAADRLAPLGVDDLERLAWAAGLAARDDEMLAIHERAYQTRLDAGQQLQAARVAFWLGFRLQARGEFARSTGWLSRSQRLVEENGEECVEQGYLLLPASQRQLTARQFEGACNDAARGAEIGERFGEMDLIAFGRNLQGRALIAQGRIENGLALLDEALLLAGSGRLSPVITGLVYCSAIASCQRVYAFDRTREWTRALSAWCETNPQLGLFTGHCLVHRAEILQLNGSWPEADAEAARAVQRCVRDIDRNAAGSAYYQRAEIYRLRGEFDSADAAYREAGRSGFDPQPGLALLRLAQGDLEAATSSIRRVVSAAQDALARTRFLPAYVEIMLADALIAEAEVASQELQQTADTFNTAVLAAIADHARAAVLLAQGNPQAALEPARRAFRVWQGLDAPYLAARLRILIGRACIALGDDESAQLELECARDVFVQLDARPDIAATATLASGSADSGPAQESTREHGLTGRELQVLRLVASGLSNKAIARELSLSERTVHRHLSNIFSKISVSSRAAATAFVYEQDLL